MSIIRRMILALALAAGIAPALAQVPPPVPALPDTERRTTYSLSGTTCACAVNFALYGDSTDYQNWVEVWINGINVASSSPTFGWTITSPTGPLSTIPRPITDAVLTFNSVQTGTVQIVGARRPRRVSQFSENRGVAARDLNQALTDIVAQNRETWDKTNDITGRTVLAPAGETLAALPILANRQNQGACFDNGGNLTSCVSVPSGTFIAGSGIKFTGTNPTTISIASSSTSQCDISAQGAVGNNATLDTAAFNTCRTNLGAVGGGIMVIPPNANCFLINAIDATNTPNITVQGSGNSSCLTINSADAAGNWMDLSGVDGWSFDNLRINDNGSTIPKVAILWACTGTGACSGGEMHDLYFNRVYMSAHTTAALLYAYGFGNVTPGGAGHGSLSCNNSTFVQLNNGASSATWSNRNTALHVTATNDLAITSANKTLGTTGGYSSGAVLTNCDFVDQVTSPSNNAGMVLFNVYPLTMFGGSIKCNGCDTDLVLASNNQGLAFYQVNFVASGPSQVSPNYWIGFVQGLNTFITIDNPFFSSPVIATLFFGPPVGALGGGWYINVRNANTAGTFGSQGFIYTGSTCTGWPSTATFWIKSSYFQNYHGGTTDSTQTGCGSIDSHTIFQGDTMAVTLPGGASDLSHHF